MDLAQIKLYRITHIDNVPHILANGITHKKSRNANTDFISIGDSSLIITRNFKQVEITNGDPFTFGPRSITLGNYIPFYFGVRMPMLYVIQHGGNFVDQPTPAENIVYLVCSLNRIINFGCEYFFSDGHATDNFTQFFDESKIEELPEIIDWDAVRASYWSGNENLTIKRKKQAEFLVSEDIPASFIIGFGCYNQSAKDKLTRLGIENDQIKIIQTAYY